MGSTCLFIVLTPPVNCPSPGTATSTPLLQKQRLWLSCCLFEVIETHRLIYWDTAGTSVTVGKARKRKCEIKRKFHNDSRRKDGRLSSTLWNSTGKDLEYLFFTSRPHNTSPVGFVDSLNGLARLVQGITWMTMPILHHMWIEHKGTTDSSPPHWYSWSKTRSDAAEHVSCPSVDWLHLSLRARTPDRTSLKWIVIWRQVLVGD